MIVITGAAGRLGGLVVERLLERRPASEVAVSVRDPARAEALAARGVRVRAAAYDDEAALRESLAGARTVLLVSGHTLGEEGVRQHARVVEAARDAGAERVVYTSHQAASAGSAFAPARDHAGTEEVLSASGLSWASLRDGFHAATLEFWVAAAAEGVLRLPEDGPVSWTTHEDLADAAVATLLAERLPDAPTPPLTGPEALDAAGVAARLGLLSGTDWRHEVVSDDAYVAGLVAHGTPEPVARLLLGMFEASRAGEFDVVDPHLAQMLGRPATPVAATLEGALGRSRAA
jgi:uncharacterized protein YbjT (DUF2867 family)